MDVRTTLVLLYPDGTAHTFADFTVQQLLMSKPIQVSEIGPIAILRPTIGKHILYDFGLMESYRRDKIPFSEVMDALCCDGLYRNKTLLKTGAHDEVEKESLWLLRDNEFILVDNDRNVTCPATEPQTLFYKIA